MSTQPSGDLPPASSASTSGGAGTPSEKPAADDSAGAPWNEIEADPAFRQLLADKLRFIVPASIFFIVYYFTLPILVGWWPDLMKREVWGHVNIAYLFALSQFFMAWALAFIYVRTAAKWDRAAAALLAKFAKR